MTLTNAIIWFFGPVIVVGLDVAAYANQACAIFLGCFSSVWPVLWLAAFIWLFFIWYRIITKANPSMNVIVRMVCITLLAIIFIPVALYVSTFIAHPIDTFFHLGPTYLPGPG